MQRRRREEVGSVEGGWNMCLRSEVQGMRRGSAI